MHDQICQVPSVACQMPKSTGCWAGLGEGAKIGIAGHNPPIAHQSWYERSGCGLLGKGLAQGDREHEAGEFIHGESVCATVFDHHSMAKPKPSAATNEYHAVPIGED